MKYISSATLWGMLNRYMKEHHRKPITKRRFNKIAQDRNVGMEIGKGRIFTADDLMKVIPGEVGHPVAKPKKK